MSIFDKITSIFFDNQSQNSSGSDIVSKGQQLFKETIMDGGNVDIGLKNAEINLENAYKRIDSINHNRYPQFKEDETTFVNQEGILWFIRKDLEAAKGYYSGGKEGYFDAGRVHSNGVSQFTPPFLKLKEDIEETEKRVQEIEQAKGYQFVSCRNNDIIFQHIETKRELTSQESNEV